MKTKTYYIDFYKTENLSSDEKNSKRKNSLGIWLCGGSIEAKSSSSACMEYRKSGQLGSGANKFRAKLFLN